MIERAQHLYDKYFGEGTTDLAEAEVQKRAQELAAIADWMGRPYAARFMQFLRDARLSNEPKPGDERSMLYSIGVRDGLDLVIGRLEALERELKQERA